MYCSRCGKEINYESRFCVDCAYEIAHEANAAAKRAGTVTGTVKLPSSIPENKQQTVNAAPCKHLAKEAAVAEIASLPAVSVASEAEPQKCESISERNNAKVGLGKAIASLIMSESTWLLFLLGTIMVSISYTYAEPVIGGFAFLASIPLSIISFIFSVSGINLFKRRSAADCKKPVATLVLSIIGLVNSAVYLLYMFIIFATMVWGCSVAMYSLL